MDRRLFLQQGAILSTSLWLPKISLAQQSFPVVRLAPAKRNFKSNAIEQAIQDFKANVADKELGWLFENCFPNTLDTTVTYSLKNGRPDTYVITGDIDAMWLRDSAAQVWPYLQFVKKDKALKDLIAGVINKQTHFILKDPYANAFYNSDTQISEWKNDLTAMKPGIHERKWEIDSLCYPIRLAYHYWKNTNDIAPFDGDWKNAIVATLKVFKEQQRKTGNGPYKFQRTTAWATDGVPLSGYGYPVNPVGLICSIFRPSDDATIYPFLVPSNFFAVVSLKQASEMITAIFKDTQLATELKDLATEVEEALHKYAIIDTPNFGKIYAFEINGYGSFNLMDDTNVPSLLSMPYLGAVNASDPVYQNTRKYVWSQNCPFFYTGKLAEGMGSPHTGADYIWPMSIIVKGLTSQSDDEIKACIKTVQKTHAGTGFVHESFHKDDPKKFTRKWFAWANTLYGEFLWKIYQEKPHLLK
jgi:meiotically up-regulated gene 157 (Mug157) protein